MMACLSIIFCFTNRTLKSKYTVSLHYRQKDISCIRCCLQRIVYHTFHVFSVTMGNRTPSVSQCSIFSVISESP